MPAQRKYFQLPGDSGAVYVIYQTMTANPKSALWRHEFETAPVGSMVTSDSKIRTSSVYSTTDVSGLGKAMDAFESSRAFVAGKSNNLDDFDKIPQTEGASVNTFWGGVTSMKDFRLETLKWKGSGIKKSKLKDAEYINRRKIVYADWGKTVGVMQGASRRPHAHSSRATIAYRRLTLHLPPCL